ncbi:glycosyltransferase [Micrococcaceae bacterium Sec5.1]
MKLKVLFLSHSADSGVFKVGSHHLARELSKMSLSVAHVSTPHSIVHKVLRRRPMKHSGSGFFDEFGTLHAIPNVFLPVQFSRSGRQIGKLIDRIGFGDADYVLVDQPLMSGYLTDCDIPGKIVYRPTDTYSNRVAALRQNDVLRVCRGVVATSAAVLNDLSIPDRIPSMVLTNGVELERFTEGASEQRRGFVYVGAVDYRFDWDSVLAIAKAFPGENLSLIGPVSVNAHSLPSNVSLVGSVPYEEIPKYMSRARVGLIPLNQSDVNQGRSPMKYYEYLAAGLTVVATSTESLRERRSPQTLLFDTPREAVASSEVALEMPSPNAEGMTAAAAQDWGGKAASLLQFLRSL